MVCIFLLLIFLTSSRSFNIQVNDGGRTINPPNYARQTRENLKFFGEALQFQKKDDFVR